MVEKNQNGRISKIFPSQILHSHCWRDNLKFFVCILLKFVLHVVNNQFLDKFNNGGGLLTSVLLFSDDL